MEKSLLDSIKEINNFCRKTGKVVKLRKDKHSGLPIIVGFDGFGYDYFTYKKTLKKKKKKHTYY